MNQKERILDYLKTNNRLPVWKIIQPRPIGLGVAQYNARVLELRREGYLIDNKRDEEGYTYFELVKERQLELLDIM
jgi:hypothetical protein